MLVHIAVTFPPPKTVMCFRVFLYFEVFSPELLPAEKSLKTQFKWNWSFKRPIKSDYNKASDGLKSAHFCGVVFGLWMLGFSKNEVSFYFLLVTLRYKFRSAFLRRSTPPVLRTMLHLNPGLFLFCSSSLSAGIIVNFCSQCEWQLQDNLNLLFLCLAGKRLA